MVFSMREDNLQIFFRLCFLAKSDQEPGKTENKILRVTVRIAKRQAKATWCCHLDTEVHTLYYRTERSSVPVQPHLNQQHWIQVQIINWQ